ncbi:MAG: hypothetical protein RJA09_438 [Pseudomonadota bacterium]|jgi:hypothetical protein
MDQILGWCNLEWFECFFNPEVTVLQPHFIFLQETCTC